MASSAMVDSLCSISPSPSLKCCRIQTLTLTPNSQFFSSASFLKLKRQYLLLPKFRLLKPATRNSRCAPVVFAAQFDIFKGLPLSSFFLYLLIELEFNITAYWFWIHLHDLTFCLNGFGSSGMGELWFGEAPLFRFIVFFAKFFCLIVFGYLSRYLDWKLEPVDFLLLAFAPLTARSLSRIVHQNRQSKMTPFGLHATANSIHATATKM